MLCEVHTVYVDPEVLTINASVSQTDGHHRSKWNKACKMVRGEHLNGAASPFFVT